MDTTHHVNTFRLDNHCLLVPMGTAVGEGATGWASTLPDRHSQSHSQCARGTLRRAPTATSSLLTSAQEAYDLALARFYMWAQTDAVVFLAIHSPTGAPRAGRRAAPASLQAAAQQRRPPTAPAGPARQGTRTGGWCWRPAPARSRCRRRARRPWWTARSRTASTRRTRLRPSGARARPAARHAQPALHLHRAWAAPAGAAARRQRRRGAHVRRRRRPALAPLAAAQEPARLRL